jgi:putative transposase
VRQRLLELAAERPRFGYRRLHVLLQREGIAVNHKKVQRLYREESLTIRRKKRQRVAQVPRQPKPEPTRVGERWSMDFMQDSLVSDRCFRTLNVGDDLSREALAIEVAKSIPGAYVARVLDRLVAELGAPDVIVMDNGPAFTSRALDAWAYENGIRLHFIPRILEMEGQGAPTPDLTLTPCLAGRPFEEEPPLEMVEFDD